MGERLNDLESEYVAALEAYCELPSEITLSQAYGLGRRALVSGLGVLDMASLHAKVVATVLSKGAPELSSLADMAGAFFSELLSPYEMTFRGYREANERLRTINETLLRQKEAVEAMNKELEAFSYSVSHDLRAPLRGIDGFSQALLEDYGDVLDEQGKKYLHYVREAAHDMARLIDGLLALSRISRAELHRTSVDIAAMARRIAERLLALEPSRQVEITIMPSAEAFGDAVLLEIVLQNLIGNAWKFTSKRAQAHIEIGKSEGGGETVYFVRDDGAGFDMAHAQQLFGAFQRLHAAREFDGTGVGLATVKRIVHRHGGKIWAEGRVGGGATFYFTLTTEKPDAKQVEP